MKVFDQESCLGEIMKRKILVVEDELLNQKISRSMLEELGYHVDIAKDGKEALAMYKNKYDVILMDIGLPDMSGIEICTQIRSQETDYIPIIAFTAFGDVVREECLSSGMDEFAIKPISIESLRKILGRVIQKNEKKN